MWYEELLIPLTSKIFYKKRKTAARHFIEKLFLFLDALFQPLPVEIPLGIIEKMHAKYGSRRNNSVHIAAFTRDLLGLSILYLKMTSDYIIKTSTFIAFIDQEEEFRALSFARDKRFAKKTSQGMINLLERITLKKFTVIDKSNPLHKNSLEVDLTHILLIVTKRKSLPLLDTMLNYFQPVVPICYPYREENDKFGDFIMELYRLKNQLEIQAIAEGFYEAEPASSHTFFAFGNPLERFPYTLPSAPPPIVKDYNPLFYSLPPTLDTGAETGAASSFTTTHFSFFTDTLLSKSQQKLQQEAPVDELTDISPPPIYSSLFEPPLALSNSTEKIHTRQNSDKDEIGINRSAFSKMK